MSTSKSSPKTTTTTSDLRTTNTLNAGLSGDIMDAVVAAGNYGDTALTSTAVSDYSDRSFTDNADNSLNVEMSDNSDRSVNDYSDRSFTDNADNSFNVDMEDNSDRSHYQTSEFSDYSDNSLTVEMRDDSDRSSYSDSSTTNITDGGAFDLVRAVGGDVIESLGESQRETLGVVDKVVTNGYDFVKESQNTLLGAVEKIVTKAMDSSTNIAQQSLQGAMQIKAGQTITDPANQTMREYASTAIKISLIGGAIYLGGKYLKG